MVSTHKEALKLGMIAPDFVANSTQGPISFHQWVGDSWVILFSHPKDFTPVCTTELGVAAKHQNDFKSRGVKLLGLSVGTLADHLKWIPDINRVSGVNLDFPLIADENHEIAELYSMIHPLSDDVAPVRSVFVIDRNKKIRLMLTYPASTGRNFTEILRVVDSMQLTDKYKVATPANWIQGHDCVILPSIQDPKEIKRLFPKGYKEVTPYLRMTQDPSVK